MPKPREVNFEYSVYEEKYKEYARQLEATEQEIAKLIKQTIELSKVFKNSLEKRERKRDCW